MSLVSDPTSVVSDDKKDIYNNILLFTVLEDTKRKSSAHSSSSSSGSTTPTEMHIFQCLRTHSAEIVDEIYRVKEGRHTSNQQSYQERENDLLRNRYQLDENQTRPMRALHSSQSSPVNGKNNSSFFDTHNTSIAINETISPAKLEKDVQILNHCFDDIERFVTRLQNASEYFKELERRQKQRKTDKKYLGDGMLSMRAQMPPPQHFVDIFQKFKLSLNLLAQLKAHIHDPNAPELVHFLFTPLSLIMNASKELPYRGLSKTVWIPLLTKESKELLLNCLTSKEQDLWLSLGDSWTVTREEALTQPQLFAHLENQIYNPIFYDGWSPSINQNEEVDSRTNENISRLAFATAAQIQSQGIHSNKHTYSASEQQLPVQKSRFYTNTQPQYSDEVNSHNTSSNLGNKQMHNGNHHQYNQNQNSSQVRTNGQQVHHQPQQHHHNHHQHQHQPPPPPPPSNQQIVHNHIENLRQTNNISQNSNNTVKNTNNNNIRNHDEMKKWAIELSYRGAKYLNFLFINQNS